MPSDEATPTGSAPTPDDAATARPAEHPAADQPPTHPAPTHPTPTYVFLSDEWMAAVRALRDEYASRGATAPVELRANLIVTEVPFADGRVLAHVDTSRGGLAVDHGHLDAPDLKVEVDWATAKALLVDGNPQAAMGAFLEGKVRIEGDVGKLMAFQTGIVDPSTHEAAVRIRAITR